MNVMEPSTIEEDLKESYRKHGPLRSCVKTQYGIAAGETRLRAVPEWKTVFREVKNYYEHLQIKAADNISSMKPSLWWEGVIKEACEWLIKEEHIERGKIVERLEKDFPLSQKTIYRYLPQEFKQPEKVKAGQASAAAVAARKSVPPVGTAYGGSYRKDLDPLKMIGDVEVQTRPRLTGGSTTYPISSNASQSLTKTDTPEHQRLFNAFQGKGFVLKDEWPIPMNKWKCGRCRQTWIEDPPLKCDRCGTEVERLNYYIDILLDDRWSVEPGGKKHEFGNDDKRDAFLLEHDIIPYHYTNNLVNTPDGPHLIVQYHMLLKKLERPEEHTLILEGGHVKRMYLDGENVMKEFKTTGPALVKVVAR